jgi:hypothetical protein
LIHLERLWRPEYDNDAPEDYWLQMTTEEIKKASQSPFITIGSHGYYHNDLARIQLMKCAKN